MAHIPKRKGTIKKYNAIQNRFNHLYKEERIRRDDAMEQVMKEYFIENIETLWRILATDIDAEMKRITFEEAKEPMQLALF